MQPLIIDIGSSADGMLGAAGSAPLLCCASFLGKLCLQNSSWCNFLITRRIVIPRTYWWLVLSSSVPVCRRNICVCVGWGLGVQGQCGKPILYELINTRARSGR